MSRAEYLSRLSEKIGNRKLVWFGIRGQDAAPLLGFQQFQSCYSMTAPLGAASLHEDVSLEALTGSRVDLDRHDIDLDQREVVRQLRRMLLSSLNSEALLCNYRAYHFTSNLHFACAETTELLGMFKERQMPFEHKPWVESSLRAEGVQIVPWRYFAEERSRDLVALLRQGPIVLRTSKSSGGTGVTLARTPDDIDNKWEPSPDSLIAVAPYLQDAHPLNIGACVFPDGTVTVHPGSFQLIGLPECTNRDFGYCGNDLSLFKALPNEIVDRVDELTRSVGRWMSRMGYVGAFGIDCLVQGDDVYFSEVNPRFQGSTALTTTACAEAGLADILLDHVAAFLGVNPDPTTARLTLREWNRLMPDRAQIILHNLTNADLTLTHPMRLIPPRTSPVTTEIVPLDGSRVEPDAILCRVVVDEPVTASGYDLLPAHRETIGAMTDAFTAIPGKEGSSVR